MASLIFRSIRSDERDWVGAHVTQHFASEKVVSRGQVHHARELPGLIACFGSERVGLAQYHVDNRGISLDLEVVILIALKAGSGVGRQLLDEMVKVAAANNCRRAWLITTNNNDEAIRFYRACGWDLVTVHHDAVSAARKLKPEIPELDDVGRPIRDEWEFELLVN